MDVLKKIDYILGGTYGFSDMEFLEELAREFSICYHALESPLLNHISLSGKLKIYSQVDDMPSFMKGLENQLRSSNLILSLGSQNISSFQSLRTAIKFSYPFFLIADEIKCVTREKYNNIYLLQNELLQKSDKVFCLSEHTETKLISSGCPKEKILTLNPLISQKRFKFSSEKRKKFRNYIKISDEKIVLLFQQPLKASYNPGILIELLRYIRSTDSRLFSKLIVLYASSGELAQNLKNEAYISDLGKSVLFLSQDSTPFIIDLYSSCDYILNNNSPYEENIIEVYPKWQIEAVSSGLVPIYPNGNLVDKYLKKTVHFLHDGSLSKIYKAILKTETKKLNITREQLANVQFEAVLKNLNQEKNINLMKTTFEKAIVKNQNKLNSGDRSISLLQVKLTNLMVREDYTGALVAIEDLLLRIDYDERVLSDLFFKKAKVLYALGDLEKTLDSLKESLQQNETNLDTLKLYVKVLLEEKLFDQAIPILKKLVARDSSDFDTQFQLSISFKETKDIESALYWCLNLLKNNYNKKVVSIQISQYVNYLIDPLKAIEYLKQALEISEEYDCLKLSLGKKYLSIGETENGKILIDSVMTASSENTSTKKKYNA